MIDGMEPEDARRSELRRFLKARRSAAAAPANGAERRRRRPGLRIEEVCALADVSSSWYGALEAGKPISVAPRTLERIAEALRLSEHDRDHLFALATPAAPRAASTAALPVRAILDGFTAGPAMHAGARLDVLACNAAAARLYGFTSERGALVNNIPWRVFTDPDRERFFANWAEHAQRVAGILRKNYAERAGNAAFDDLIARLRATSADFREHWERVEVRGPSPLRKRLFVAGVGEFVLDITLLPIPNAHESIIVQTPAGERDAALLAQAIAEPVPALE